MKLSQLFSLSVLMSLALSTPVAEVEHHAHQHKRAVKYVTQVSTVVVGDGQTQTQAQANQGSNPTTLVTSSQQGKAAAASSTGEDEAPSSTEASSSESSGSQGQGKLGINVGASASLSIGLGSSSSSSSSDSSSSASTPSDYSDVEKYAAEAKGITYSPYTKSGSCKSSDEVSSDLKKLSGFGVIRIYGTDCSGPQNVLSALNSNQKLFVGIQSISDLESDLSSLDSAIKGSERGWDAIDTVSIGNELVNGGSNSASDVAQAVKKAKSWLKSNASSFSGSVVTVDTLVAVENNSGDLCDASDYLAVNSHPFWDGNVDPSDAGPWLKQQISDLQEKCGNNGKKVVITETGWPTKGDSFQKCQPSTKNQLAAIKSISETIGDQVIFFTTYNDYWKDAGNYDVEQYWGIFGDPSN